MKHRLRSHPLRFAATVALATSVYAAGGAGFASADEYSVQIGAFQNPDPSFSVAAETVGKLYQTRNANGITRVQVGRYASEEEAKAALRALNLVGYTDAYVVNKSAKLDDAAREAMGTGPRSAPIRASALVSTRGDEGNLMADVPAELRDRTVLLDGRLHVVDGDRFIPLRDYIAGRR